jgi:hypothetical protein
MYSVCPYSHLIKNHSVGIFYYLVISMIVPLILSIQVIEYCNVGVRVHLQFSIFSDGSLTKSTINLMT